MQSRAREIQSFIWRMEYAKRYRVPIFTTLIFYDTSIGFNIVIPLHIALCSTFHDPQTFLKSFFSLRGSPTYSSIALITSLSSLYALPIVTLLCLYKSLTFAS